MKNLILGFVILVVVISGVAYWQKNNIVEDASYNPVINPADFTTEVNNQYFQLIPGRKLTYEGKKDDGVERIEVTVTDENKTVMGVEVVVVRDTVWLNDEIIEDTKDYYAQDKAGNVWYFGEDTAEYENGVIINHHGAWEAGVDGAKPGMVMLAQPKVGDTYRQEYFVGEAEDMADVLSVTESVTVPFGTFKNCLKTFDYTPLDETSLEHKYYCADAGGLVLEVDTTSGEKTELIKIEVGGQGEPVAPVAPAAKSTPTPAPTPKPITPIPVAPVETPKKNITEAEAKAIALMRVPGTVTDFGIEKKFGKDTYVVEVKTTAGGESDVIIDMMTGEVLGVEQ